MYALTVPETADLALPDRVPGGRGRCVQQRHAQRANSVRRAIGLPAHGAVMAVAFGKCLEIGEQRDGGVVLAGLPGGDHLVDA